MSIRSTAKALIVSNSKVLLNKCMDSKNGEYYSLPGGGQHKYEMLYEAVVRECKEETGYEIKPLKLACVCEEICLDESFRDKHPDYAHKMYHVFMCESLDIEPEMPTEKDDMQISSEWIAIEHLARIRLLPRVIGENIISVLNGTAPIFLGSEYVRFNHG